jgi:hypothetical protein
LTRASRAGESRVRPSCPLCELYSEAAGQDATDGGVMSWHLSEGSLTVAVGTCGILIVIAGGLKTVLLGRQDNPEATRLSKPKDAIFQPFA